MTKEATTKVKTGKDKILKIMIPVSNALRKVGIDLRNVLFKSIHEAFGGELKEIVCGGAPIRPVIGKFFNDIGITLYNGYGITECSPLVSVNRAQLNDSSTVGDSGMNRCVESCGMYRRKWFGYRLPL